MKNMFILLFFLIFSGCAGSSIISPIQHFENIINSNLFLRAENGYIGSGTYLIYHEQPFVLTAAHVLENAEETEIEVCHIRPYESNMNTDCTHIDVHHEMNIISSPYPAGHDYALVALRERLWSPIPAVVNTEYDLHIGELIYIVGNPVGYSNIVSSGVVSGIMTFETGEVPQIWFTDADAYFGSSGGGVYNSEGNLIGYMHGLSATRFNGIMIPVDGMRQFTLIRDWYQNEN